VREGVVPDYPQWLCVCVCAILGVVGISRFQRVWLQVSLRPCVFFLHPHLDYDFGETHLSILVTNRSGFPWIRIEKLCKLFHVCPTVSLFVCKFVSERILLSGGLDSRLLYSFCHCTFHLVPYAIIAPLPVPKSDYCLASSMDDFAPKRAHTCRMCL
jgi:hypothetical protein